MIDEKAKQLELPIEIFDFLDVIEMGARKYNNLNWLEPGGQKSSFTDMHASMFRHLANSQAGVRLDSESGLDHLLHLAARALMMHARLKKGVKHPNDK